MRKLVMGLVLGLLVSCTNASLQIELQEYLSGLSSPLFLTHAKDGSGDVYVVERGGSVVLRRSGASTNQTFLDISDRVLSGGEQGLLGLAFHPNYKTNGYLYVNYTSAQRDNLGLSAGTTVIARYTANPSSKTADPGSEQILLTINQPFANHNGGWLGFGPDGFLYIANGDGGSGGDPQNHGQRLDSLLGKMLRIDVDKATAGKNYAIPSDNPFVGRSGALAEIWAYGLRNPWRGSFDRQTGDLWVADVGQGAIEEVNHVTGAGKGLNYGWKIMEGDQCYGASSCNRSGLTLPVYTYSHSGGRCSVTGGYVYRGNQYPALRGVYLLADYCTGEVFSLRSGVGKVELTQASGVASFGEDEAGELYLLNIGQGKVFRVKAK